MYTQQSTVHVYDIRNDIHRDIHEDIHNVNHNDIHNLDYKFLK